MSEKLYKASDVIGVLMNVCSDDDYLKATDWLSGIPSAVVWCKDCRHWVKQKVGGSCEIIPRLGASGNFFCALGERISE